MPTNLKATHTNGQRSTKRWRLYVTLVVCSALPLVLFLYTADRWLRKAYTHNLLQVTGPAAGQAADALTQPLANAKGSLEALAADPALRDAWKHHDTPRLIAILRTAHELKRDVASFAIYDSSGRLRAGYPASFARTDLNSAPPGWFTRAKQTGSAYVSGVAMDAGDGPGITVAAPLDAEHPIAVISATYRIATLKSWMSAVAPSTMKWISVVDQNGVVLAGAPLGPSGAVLDLSSHPEVKQVLAGKDGTEFLWLGGKRTLVTRHPLPSLGWGVLVEIPVTEIDNAIWKLEKPIGFIALAFIGFALVVGVAVAFLYRRLRESEEQTRQIVTASIDAFVAIDQKGAITEWNPKAEELFGWPRGEAIGQTLHSTIIPPQYREAHLRGLRHLLATGEGPILNKRIELAALDQDGHEFPVELSITRVHRGGKVSFNAFLHDITKRKQAEEQIGSLNVELSSRIAQLEERNKALEAFSYSVSHDVRAPLRHIAGLAQILHEDYAQQLSAGGLDYLGRIHENVVRMQRLVDDLLRFARLGAQGLALQHTDLNEVVHEVIASLENEIAGRQVTFDVSPLPHIDCDRGLVRQVFWNLLANAVKFASIRDHAVISVGISSQDGEEVLFVRDNGIGFDMNHAGQLFGAFQRLHLHDEFEGTGVGLATVQNIISKHQGRIWAHAELDRGATFFFSLWPRQASDRLPLVAHGV
jgi:PAS domain S-box-containing protein